jgi:hypothetical protein
MNGEFCTARFERNILHYVLQRPRRLTLEWEGKLNEMCPGPIFFEKYRQDDQTCCNPGVLTSLDRIITQFETFFESCPTCMYDMRILFCRNFCPANQAKMIRVTPKDGPGKEKVNSTDPSSKLKASKIQVAFVEKDLDVILNSCRKAKGLTSGQGWDQWCGQVQAECGSAREFAAKTPSMKVLDVGFKFFLLDRIGDELVMSGKPEADLGSMGPAGNPAKVLPCNETAPMKEAKGCKDDECVYSTKKKSGWGGGGGGDFGFGR